MKKMLSLILAIVLMFVCCVGCDKKTDGETTENTTVVESVTGETVNATDGETDVTDEVEKSEENEVTEDSTTANTEDTTEVSEENTTKPNGTNPSTKPSEKPSNNSGNAKPSTPKPSNPTTEKPTNKPTEKPTEKPTSKPTEKPTPTKPSASKPYFVSMDVVSVNRPNSFTVNGTHILDKIYGKNAVLQNGDTITYKMNMSDGGTTGFKLSYKKNCSVTTNGNIITVKVNGAAWSDAIVEFTVDTKTGSEKVRKTMGIHSITGSLGTAAAVDCLIQEYAISKGMILLNGTEDEPVLNYKVKVPGNSNWKSEVFVTIDKCVNSGYKKYCYQLVPQDAFSISMYA